MCSITTKHDCLVLRSTLCTMTFTNSPNRRETEHLHPRLQTIRLVEQTTLSVLLFIVNNGAVLSSQETTDLSDVKVIQYGPNSDDTRSLN